MAYVCGNAGYVDVGTPAVRLDVTSWEAAENVDLSETTNTSSGGYKQSISCKKYMNGTVNADFDPVLGPKFSPTIAAGDLIALVLNTDASGAYTLEAHVTRLNWTQPAGDKVSFSFDFESDGAYNYA